jgi:hypothetical protein
MRKDPGRGESADTWQRNCCFVSCTFAIPVMNLVDDINHTGNEMFTNLVQGPVLVERVYYERCSMMGGA